MKISDANMAICQILGIPTNCTKAIITLEGGKPPVVEIHTFVGILQETEMIHERKFKLVPVDSTADDSSPCAK